MWRSADFCGSASDTLPREEVAVVVLEIVVNRVEPPVTGRLQCAIQVRAAFSFQALEDGGNGSRMEVFGPLLR